MSGRLVILRHKSWHVWNQDNREKVLKDERLHEEEVKRKVDVENRLIQEKTYEVLSSVSRPVEEGTGCTDDGGVGEGEGGSKEQPFRLFGDIEQQALLAKKSSENAEYVAEKMKSEQLKRKREGVEPWLLGDGSHEIKKNKPWYEVVKKEHSSSSDQSIDAGRSRSSCSRRAEDNVKAEINTATAREIKRKDRTDPMHSFLHPKIDFLFMQEKVKEEPDQLTVAVKKECIDGVIDPDEKNYERSGSHDDTVEKKKEERDHESRHHRHHKHRKEHKSRKSKSSRDNKLNGKNDDAYAIDTVNSRDHIWDAIRKERLEREAFEKKRSAVLLAKRDIYGQATAAAGAGVYDRYGCSESYGYGQQYHPHLAKTYQR